MAKISYFSLGGQDEKDRYSGILEINNEIFILNTGIGTEIANEFGIKKVIPDFRTLGNKKSQVKAIFLGCPKRTNIGSIAYFLDFFPSVPVYTNPLGKRIIETFLEEESKERKEKINANIIAVNPSNDISFNSLKVCGVKISNSIPNSYGWLFKLFTGETIVFLDEFLIANENKPCCESQLHIITQQSKNKTSLLLLGSQSAGKVLGFSYPQAQNFDFLKRSISSTRKRIIVAAYDDDWNTLLNLSQIAKIYLMNFYISSPVYSELFNEYVKSLKKDEYALSTNFMDTENILIVVLGNSETLYRTLSEINEGKHEISFNEGDLFIIATITMPENEVEEINLLNKISKHEILVLKQPKSIVSYMAGNEDIKAIVNLLSPFNIVPINGYYKDFVNVHKALINTIDPKRIKFLESGDLLEISDKSSNISKIPISKQYVSEQGILDISSTTLLERQLITKNGFVLVSILYNPKNHSFSKPVCFAKGLYPDDSIKRKETDDAIFKFVNSELAKYLGLNSALDIRQIKQYIKKAVNKALEQKTHKKPLIIPLITNMFNY